MGCPTPDLATAEPTGCRWRHNLEGLEAEEGLLWAPDPSVGAAIALKSASTAVQVRKHLAGDYRRGTLLASSIRDL